MGLPELQISYNTSDHDIDSEFYLPCLAWANRLERGVGYFTTGWISKNARGLAQFVTNGGIAKWITSPILDEKDYGVLNSLKEMEKLVYLEKIFEQNVEKLQNEMEQNTKNAFAWMVHDGVLEIRFAIPTCKLEGDFHTKFGIFYGPDNQVVAFEGSNNDSKNHFITSSIEHKAVMEPMKYLEKKGYVVDFIDPDPSGRISVEKVIAKITDKTAMVSIMHVNSETGIIQPVQEIGEFLEDKGIYFHVDATQSFGKMNEEIKKIPYDMLSISAHKIRGPQGVGALILRRKKHLRDNFAPLILGGGQEFGFRSGTLPVALIGGFGQATELCERKSLIRKEKCKKIKEQFLKEIKSTEYIINGDPQYCIDNTINISFKDVDAEGIFVATKNFYAMSNGSACVSGAYTSSYVLKAMGLDEKRISEAIRLSWDYDTDVNFSELVMYVRGQQEG